MFKAFKRIFKPSDERRALEFWTWFAANEQHYRDIAEDGIDERDHRIKVFLDHLAPYDSELTFLTGKHEDGMNELIISADGMKKHFGSVEFLIDAAPVIKGWRLIALKPPQPQFGPLELNDKTFDLEQVQFARLDNPKDPGEFNIAVFHPPYVEDEQDLHVVATFLMLDSLLGERSVAEDIAGLDIKPLSAEVPANVLRPLRALPRAIADAKSAASKN